MIGAQNTRDNPAVVDWQQFHQFLLQTPCPELSLNQTLKAIDDNFFGIVTSPVVCVYFLIGASVFHRSRIT
jgi:hypothetical protein